MGEEGGQPASDPSPQIHLDMPFAIAETWPFGKYQNLFFPMDCLSQKLLDPRSRDHKMTIQVKSSGHPPFCFSPEIGSGSLAGLLEFDCPSVDQLTLNKMAFATANNRLD